MSSLKYDPEITRLDGKISSLKQEVDSLKYQINAQEKHLNFKITVMFCLFCTVFTGIIFLIMLGIRVKQLG